MLMTIASSLSNSLLKDDLRPNQRLNLTERAFVQNSWLVEVFCRLKVKLNELGSCSAI